MKITAQELQYIKKRIPLITEIISGDFFGLKDVLYKNGYKRIAFCIWDHWLLETEANLIYSKDNEELKERQSKFLSLLHNVYQNNKTFTWQYNKWRKKFLIRKISSFDSLVKSAEIEKMTADGGGGYDLILPDNGVIIETDYDWTGTITYKADMNYEIVLEQVKNAGLYLIKYK